MMNSTREVVRFVDILIELTQNNTIRWERNEAPMHLQSSIEIVDFLYISEYEGKLLGLYENRYKHFFDEDAYSWDSELILEFLDTNLSPYYRFPSTRNLYNLLNSVRYQTSDVDSFINTVLKKT